MEVPDIWNYILNLTDVNELPKICSTNYNLYNICNDSYFWREKFRISNIPLMREHKILSNWIKEYTWKKYTLEKTGILLDKLINNRLPGLDSTEKGIYISMSKINDIRMFITPEMDESQIMNIYLNQLLYVTSPNEPWQEKYYGQIIIRNDENNEVNIGFHNEDSYYKINISIETCQDFIFKILYYDMQPYDVYTEQL